jgi:perosamine synthetase
MTSAKSAVRIPWFAPQFDAADQEAVRRTVADGYVNEGPLNRAFEQALREHFQVPYAITTPSGTMALALSLMALGVGPGQLVLVPDITFIGTASAVRLAGAEPVLVDVDPRTFNMDPDDARRRLRPGVRAILPVHLNGRAADLAALRALAEEKELHLIEDAAEALACRDPAGWLGTLSEAGCFSLAPTKIITSGQGGFVLTHRPGVYENIVRLKDHGRLSRASDAHPVTGYNFKVTDLQAALAISQWAKLEARIARLESIDRQYREGLAGIPDLECPDRPGPGGHLMWPDFKSRRRDELVRHLAVRGIATRPMWPAIHTQPAYAAAGRFPGADEVSGQAGWLPCSPNITDADVRQVIESIRDFFQPAA